ncbi:hypothetical protein GHT06_009048 [Daphnia sinensis]|uniref:Uncharacterized protein n=1 Tax=Daphnia sinensis TaxID=1820382 RepID=A0AAD5LWB3_9CRUS|nr:hypothetical protein GHT06_009048 [Daphnia sinensis]
MSLTSDKRTNGKWTIGYPMDVLWTMCAKRNSSNNQYSMAFIESEPRRQAIWKVATKSYMKLIKFRINLEIQIAKNNVNRRLYDAGIL